MSLIRAVTVGTLVGVAAAFGIFVAAGPDDLGRVAAPAAPTYAPVPTPTVTELAGCTPPAKLTKGVCVTTKPGPRITVTPPTTASTTSAARTAPRTAPAPAPRATEEQDEDEREDDEHEDEHEDEDEDDEREDDD